MKYPSSSIYRLIGALSKSEKRYFTLYAQRHQSKGGNNLDLFRLIKDKKIASDEALREYLEKNSLKEASIEEYSFGNYLPVAKKLLMEALLSALSQFDGVSSIDETIKSHCHKANILFKKGLLEDCQKYCKKAKKMALSFERFHLILEVIEIQKKVIAQQYYNEHSFEELTALFEETNYYLKILENKNAYWLLFSKIYKLHFQDSGKQNKEHQMEMLDLMNSGLLQEESQALSTSAELDFLQLNALKCFIVQEAQRAFEFNKQFLDKFEQNANLLQTQPERYRSTLNNFLIDCVQLKYEQELKMGLEKLRALPQHKAFKKLQGTDLQVFRLSYQVELNWNIGQGNFVENCFLVPTLEKELESYKGQLVEQSLVVFYYLIAYSYFAIGDFEKSLDWSNKIVNETNKKVMEGIQAVARIINLLAHFELGNNELLFYSLENIKRYLKKQERFQESEQLLFVGLEKLLKQEKAKELSTYQKMAEQLKSLKRSGTFDYYCWVLAKLESQSYETVYQRLVKEQVI